MPPRNATGMNTEQSTRMIAINAPDTSRIASMEASIASIFSTRIRRSTFSSTTIASSTTMPMASTIAKSVSTLMDRPSRKRPANVPTMETGTASIGITVARHVCRKRNTTASTSTAASKIVTSTSWIEALTTMVVSNGMM